MSAQIFQNSTRLPKILHTRYVTSWKFRTEYAQILDTNLQNCVEKVPGARDSYIRGLEFATWESDMPLIAPFADDAGSTHCSVL
jgi:hypothetical protein